MSNYYIEKENIKKRVTCDVVYHVRKKGIPKILATFKTRKKAENHLFNLDQKIRGGYGG